MSHQTVPALEVAITLLKVGRRIAEWHGERCSEQMLIETMCLHPDLPWSIAITGLSADDEVGYRWARKVLRSIEMLSDGNVA